jgi:ABC-2 type transport system ATP-binding protein
LFQGNPSTSIDEVSGKIWKKKIRKNQLEEYRANFRVLSERLLAGSPEIRIFNTGRPDGFERADADLEDVYFTQLTL